LAAWIDLKLEYEPTHKLDEILQKTHKAKDLSNQASHVFHVFGKEFLPQFRRATK
jgi:hypothetical protein